MSAADVAAKAANDALRALARRHGALEFDANAIRNACRPAPGLTSEETDAIYAFARRFSDAAEAMNAEVDAAEEAADAAAAAVEAEEAA